MAARWQVGLLGYCEFVSLIPDIVTAVHYIKNHTPASNKVSEVDDMTEEDKVNKMIEAVDQDHDEILSLAEIDKYGDTEMRRSSQMEYVKKLLREADTDGDGQVPLQALPGKRGAGVQGRAGGQFQGDRCGIYGVQVPGVWAG